jgi:branched-chain amino acid transport system substrate-binding protein
VRRATLLLSIAALTGPVAGCGDGSDEPTRVSGDRLTVYASLPAHGDDARAGADAELGMRRALADADGRAAGRRVRLTVLPANRPEDASWDPGTIEANAERAADDPTTIAYIGELDQGASAVSLPVTNRRNIFQVSPADGLTSLTRRPPGRPRAGPERYYPDGQMTFVRLVPPDLEAARTVVESLRERKVRRLTVVHGEQIAERELEGMVLALIGTGQPRDVTRVALRDDDPDAVTDVIEEVVAARPEAVLYAGAAGPAARQLIAALGDQLGDVPLWGGPPLVADPPVAGAPSESCGLTGVPRSQRLTPRGRRLLTDLRRESGRDVGTEALLGYEAMQLTLDAVKDGGPDRRRVARAAHFPREREGVIGPYGVTARGDVTGRSLVCVPLG